MLYTHMCDLQNDGCGLPVEFQLHIFQLIHNLTYFNNLNCEQFNFR